jgi:hypothetical protein
MGASAFYFSNLNPTGRYKLKLDDPVQRQVAKSLVFINRRVNKKIAAKEMFDRSQGGNQSCFRNERVNGYKFVWYKAWTPPQSGTFECDFVCLDQRPSIDKVAHDRDVKKLAQWFDMTFNQLKSQVPASKQSEGMARIG